VAAIDEADIEAAKQALKAKPGPNVTEFMRLRQDLMELLFASTIDNFETYVVSILREILQKNQES